MHVSIGNILVLKGRHLKVKYVCCLAAKCFSATKQVATNPGSLKPNNVNIFTEFNGLDQALFHYRSHGKHWSVRGFGLLLHFQMSFIHQLCISVTVN